MLERIGFFDREMNGWTGGRLGVGGLGCLVFSVQMQSYLSLVTMPVFLGGMIKSKIVEEHERNNAS